jgi:riboflavin synthase
MFTGIVEAVGRIDVATRRDGGCSLGIDVGTLDLADVAVGDSIAVDGCCLTVVAIQGRVLGFDVSAETLSCTTGLDEVREVNLEKALRFGDRLDGHLMQGHVDGVGTVVRREPVPGDPRSIALEIEAPAELTSLIAPKGSIAVSGVSLTSNRVDGRVFSVNLIPHTLDVTTLKNLAPGDKVNLEIDVLARYVARLVHTP